MQVLSIHNTTTEAIEEGTPNEYLYNLILNSTNYLRNIRKHPDRSSIYDYLKKSLPDYGTI